MALYRVILTNVSDLFRALHDIHGDARGIIHCDIYDPYPGIGMLCDFGLASVCFISSILDSKILTVVFLIFHLHIYIAHRNS